MVLFLFAIVLSSLPSYGFDIREIPASTSVESAQENLEIKRKKLIDFYAQKELTEFPFETFENKALSSVSAAAAKVKLGVDLASVNQYLLNDRFKPGLVGTRIKIAGGLCKRFGDYDFVLQELIRIAYYGGDKLSLAARNKLYYELLNTTGNNHYKSFRICGVKKVDTENHILMTETARYLTNQILLKETGDLQYDNEANGFNDWMANHLDQLAKHGFSEINARSYAGYTISTLLNLYDLAESEVVKKGAHVLLDYVNMKYAMESIGNRRLVIMRRRKEHYNQPRLDHHDPQAPMAMYWFGNYHYLFNDDIELKDTIMPYGAHFAFNAALSSYRPDDLIYQHIFNPAEKSVQIYKHEHGALQTVVKTPDFVFSGGGHHVKMWPKWSLDNDVLAAPAIIIPKHNGSKMDEMIYFLGHNKVSKRNNNCVSEGFICGFNLHLPMAVKNCPMVERGNWSFYDLSSCDASAYTGYHLAVYKKDLSRSRTAENYGLVEIKKATTSFNDYIEKVLDNNAENFDSKGISEYVNSKGVRLIFKIDPGSRASHFLFNAFENPERVYGSHHYLKPSRMLIWSPDYRESREYPLLTE